MRKVILILLTFVLLLAPIQVGCRNGDITRLSFTLPVRIGRLNSTIIKSQSDLGDYVLELEQQSGWHTGDTTEFLQNVNQWQINFSTQNLILYIHFESSGGTVVTVDEPMVMGIEVTIGVHRPVLGMTTDIGIHPYIYKVGKHITSVTFIIDGRDGDVCFRMSEGEIIVQ